MKTFIFTFLLLAGHSFWETKADLLEQDLTKLDCFWKLAEASPDFISDFLKLVCEVTKDIPSKERVEKMKAFAEKYKNLVKECDIYLICGITAGDVLDTADDPVIDIAGKLLKLCDALELSKVIDLLCTPLECILKKITEPSKTLESILKSVNCKDKGSLDTLLKTLVSDDCFPLKLNEAGNTENLNHLLVRTILANEKLEHVVKSLVCLAGGVLKKLPKVGV